MKTKNQLRKKFLSLRKRKYFEVSNRIFDRLASHIRQKIKTIKKPIIALYFPSNYEIDILKILKNLKKLKVIFLLPKIQNNNLLKFVEWKEKDVLLVNKYGIPEPLKIQKKNYLPDIVLVPLLAFDNNKNRLGYGKGFYDKYLNKLYNLKNEVEAIGVAFSFQKYKKIPSSHFDFKLNDIFTEKGFTQ